MVQKTYAELSQATDVQDGDLIATYRGSGPLKATTWSVLRTAMAAALGAIYLRVSNNLSDIANAATARANLGLGNAAIANVGNAAGTVAAGNDSRITGAAQLTGATFSGTVTAPQFNVDSGFNAYLFGGASPLINFDANDFLQYVRGTNTYYFEIGGSPALTITASGIAAPAFSGPLTGSVTGNVTGNLTGNVTGSINGATGTFSGAVSASSATYSGGISAPAITFLTNGYISGGTGNLLINFDANDYLQYDRTANAYNFYINGVNQLQITGSGINTTAPITASGGVIGNLTGNAATATTASTASTGATGFTINGTPAFRQSASRSSANITISTSTPSGGADGDLWFQI